MKACTIFLIQILLFSLSLKAQEEIKSTEKTFSKHSVNIELFGKGFWFGSASYEYNVKPNFILGAGLGYRGYLSGQSNRSVDGISETGSYKDLYLFIPVYAMYKLGKKKHHLVATVGNSFISLYYYNDYPSETMLNHQLIMSPFAGLGYEFEPGRYFYRINIYAEYLGDNAWYPTVIPWLGFSFGRHF